MALFRRRAPERPAPPHRPGRLDVAHKLTAAATPLRLGDHRQADYLGRLRQGWQYETLERHRDVPEAGNAARFLANNISRCRILPAIRQGVGADPEPDDATQGQDLLDWLDEASPGGLAGVMAGLTVNLEFPGESHLVYTAANSERPEAWDVASIVELVTDGGNWLLRDNPADTGRRLSEEAGDVAVRLFLRDPFWSSLAWSPMGAVLDILDELLLLQQMSRGHERSRLTNNLLLYSQGLSFGPKDPTRDGGDGEARADPFAEDLEQLMVTAVQRPDTASSMVPGTVSVPANLDIDKAMKVIELSRGIVLADLTARQEQCILRFARGVNLSAETVTGHANTTYANAGAIERADFDDYVAPLLTAEVNMLTTGWYRPLLLAGGMSEREAQRCCLWFDASPLFSKPEQLESADKGLEEMALSWSKWREVNGYDDGDAPSDDELRTRVAIRATRIDPTLLGELLKDSIAPTIEVPAPAGGALASVTAAANMTGAIVTVEPRPEEAALLALDGGEAAEVLHVTLAYIGDTATLTDEDRAAVDRAVAAVATRHPALEGTVGGIGHFAPDGGEVACLGLVDALGLGDLRAELVDALALAGVNLDTAHDFQPHMTLAYHPDGAHDSAADAVVGTGVHFDAVTVRWGSVGPDSVQATPLTGPEPVVTAAVIAAGSPGRRHLGARMAGIDERILMRLTVAADAALARALEKAGARLVSRARAGAETRALASNVAATEVGSVFGPALVAALGLSDADLLASSFDALGAQFDSWVMSAQHEVLALLGGASGLVLSPAQLAAAKARFAIERAAAWVLLAGSLNALAADRLYNPHPDLPAVGEASTSFAVPAGVVRAALARAGGNEAVRSDGIAAGVAAAGLPPVGGVAIGPIGLGLAGEGGAVVDGWEWQVGAPDRPFEPHQDLDGVTFTNFDDEILTNLDTFPTDTPRYFPGDHLGCECQAVPVLLTPSGAVAEEA
jgi:2'-5' RNA ligase